jgi:hypothetical protein
MWYLEGVLQKCWNLQKKLEVDDPTLRLFKAGIRNPIGHQIETEENKRYLFLVLFEA